MTGQDQKPAYATTAEVSAYLRVPVTTLYQWRHRGVGPPAVRIGRGLLYDWGDVHAYVKAKREAEKT